ncbi:MAG: FAD-linked oxidase C-terminal domain-containing protein [Nevskia sp.]|nr:FAD-linked oxidase C-terminal domain-containing protein [Nevskia sp.]
MTAELDPAARRSLLQILPPDRLLLDPADCLAYSYDNSRRSAMPQAVALAASASEVQALVAACCEHRVPLVARGRGTSTTGAAVPVAGGLVLSLERMNRILRLVPGDRLLECEAGALNGEVQAEAARHGLFWAPDPSSAGYSTVGGNLACNAGGPRAVKYGTARDNVLGLDAVGSDGVALRTGCRTTKGVVGYDLTRLLVGSEGTLAVITQATLKLLPRPETRRMLRAAYRDVAAAAAAVARLMAQPETPSSLEFLDGEAVRLAQSQRDCGLGAEVGALLLLEVDGAAASIGHAVAAVSAAAAGDGLLDLRAARDEAEADTLWAVRKALSPALRSLAPKKVNEDVAVPVSRLPELVAGIAELSRRHALRIVTFGHAGNGNLHVNLLANPDDAVQMKAIESCLGEVFRLVLRLDGTLSGEHGVGLDKRDFVAWEIQEAALERMRGIKRVFDPKGILNPGKALPGI